MVVDLANRKATWQQEVRTKRDLLITGPETPDGANITVAFEFQDKIVKGPCLIAYDADAEHTVYMSPALAIYKSNFEYTTDLKEAIESAVEAAEKILEERRATLPQ